MILVDGQQDPDAVAEALMVVVARREGQTVEVLDMEAPLAEDCALSDSSVFAACSLESPCCVLAWAGASGRNSDVDYPICSDLFLASPADPSDCSKADHLLPQRLQPSLH